MRTVRAAFKAVPYSRDHELTQKVRDGSMICIHAYGNINGMHRITYHLFDKEGALEKERGLTRMACDRLNDAKWLVTEDIN